VSETHRSWREGTQLAQISKARPPVGTTFSFTLTERATVRFAFTERLGGRRVNGECVAQTNGNRHRSACLRTVTRGTLSFAGHPGSDRVFFDGRMSRSRRLPPGAYTLIITATNAARQHSSPRRLSFTIIK
jgi:hypothetical protein